MQPPRLAAIAHGKLSSRVYSKFSCVGTNSFSRYAVARLKTYTPAKLDSAAAAECRISLIRRKRGTTALPEKFRHKTPSPILL